MLRWKDEFWGVEFEIGNGLMCKCTNECANSILSKNIENTPVLASSSTISLQCLDRFFNA